MRVFLYVVGAIGGIVMAAAGVSPEEAASNLWAWVHIIGIDNPPEILQAPWADSAGFWGGAIVLIICLAALLFSHRRAARLSGYLPMKDAAARVYSTLRTAGNSHFINIVDQLCECETERLEYVASRISTCIKVYGKFPPSDQLEQIPLDTLRGRYKFVNGGNELHRRSGFMQDERPVYRDCSIKASDINAVIAELSRDDYLVRAHEFEMGGNLSGDR